MSLQSRLADLITAIGADIKALKTSVGLSETRTTTYVNATQTATDVFTGFTPVANKRYAITAKLSVQSNAATTGVQTAVLGPASGVTRSAVRIVSADGAATVKHDNVVLNTYQVAIAGLTTPSMLIIEAIVEMGASPGAGNIRIGAKSEVAVANGIQIFPGSSMEWREV